MTMAVTPESHKRPSRSLRASPSAPTMKRRPPFFPSPSSPVAICLSPSSPISLTYLADHFITKSKLGSGCFGEVRLVTFKDMNVDFALKEFKVDKRKVRNGLNFTKNQLEEVRTHKSIAFHPNVVSFMQAWREDRTLYMLMELCETSLEDYWRKENTLNTDEIGRVAGDGLQGLNHLASSNIGHFDVKPANILRTESGTYKLADFTVARTLDKIEQYGGCSGDRRYLAPEVLEEQFTLKADVYSLGLTIAEISLPSSSPLTAEEWTILKQEQRLPERVAEVLDHAALSLKVQRMIERDHLKRPSAAELLEGKRIDPLDVEMQAMRVETTKMRLVTKRHRLSLSASDEREMRENRSPLVNENHDLVFDCDDNFFTMPSLMSRLSLGVKRRGAIKFNIED